MTALESILSPTQFERVGLHCQLIPAIADGAVLGHTSRQRLDLAEFPIGAQNEDGTFKYTPGGVALTGANLMAAVANAYDDAVAAGGGTVLIPAGHWSLNLSDALHKSTTHNVDNIKICGSGMDCTVLELPEGYSNTLFKFSGEASPGSFHTNGGLSELSINCVTFHPSNTGTALHIESCINWQSRNLTIRNFAGGTGWKARKVGIDGTNQYPQLWNVTCASNGVNFDWQSMVNGQAYGMYSNAAVVRDWLFDDVKFSIYGGNIQSTAPILVELAGEGGCRIRVYDFYYEGFSNLLFKLNSPTVTFNVFEVHGWHVGGNPAVLLDTDPFNSVVLDSIYGAGNAGVIVKARGGSDCTLINAGNPVDNPEKFDLDSASRARLVCLNSGGVSFVPSLRGVLDIHAERCLISGEGVRLPGFATGAEPTGSTGDTLRDSTLDRPAFKAATGGYKRVALAQDDNDITQLLRPYAAEIFDPSVFRTISLVSGNLDALTGILAGSVISALTAGQRPAYNYGDDYFRGFPSFACALTGNKFLQGTLATPVAAGSRAGLFAVYRCEPGTNDAANRRFAVYAEHASDHGATGAAFVLGQSDLNSSNQAYGFLLGTNALAFGLGALGTDANGHAALVYSDAAGVTHYDRDADASGTGGDPGITGATVDRVSLGGAWNTATYVGCNIVIAYAAILKSPVDPDTRVKVVRAALSRYALR